MRNRKRFIDYVLDILIIIIGVIIAFYLTRYGDKIQRDKNEQAIVEQIYRDLQSVLGDLETDFVLHKTGYDGNLRAIKFMDNQTEMSDSLIIGFYWMTKDEYIFPSTSGYENLKSFGVNLLKDDTLRYGVTYLYNQDFPRISKGNTLHPDINDYLTPFFKEHFRVNRDTSLKFTLTYTELLKAKYPRKMRMGVHENIGFIPINPEELLRNEEFRFLIWRSLEYRRYKIGRYRNSISHVKMIMQRIEEHYL